MQAKSSDEAVILSNNVRFRAVAGDGVLLHLESGRVIVINEVGLHIIKELKRSAATPKSLAASIVAEFEVSDQQAQADLNSFLQELQKEGVLEWQKRSVIKANV